MTKELNFTVEALARAAVKVSWEDETHVYHFTAATEGDQLTKVVSTDRRNRPAIVRKGKVSRRIDFLDVANGEWAAVILNATRAIRNGKLATAAYAEFDARRAAAELELIANNAAMIRRALNQVEGESHALANVLGTHGLTTHQSAALTEVADLPDAFLHRLAVVLGVG